MEELVNAAIFLKKDLSLVESKLRELQVQKETIILKLNNISIEMKEFLDPSNNARYYRKQKVIVYPNAFGVVTIQKVEEYE